jgi:hypothetical protein
MISLSGSLESGLPLPELTNDSFQKRGNADETGHLDTPFLTTKAIIFSLVATSKFLATMAPTDFRMACCWQSSARAQGFA